MQNSLTLNTGAIRWGISTLMHTMNIHGYKADSLDHIHTMHCITPPPLPSNSPWTPKFELFSIKLCHLLVLSQQMWPISKVAIKIELLLDP